jgi:hypothetical protein
MSTYALHKRIVWLGLLPALMLALGFGWRAWQMHLVVGARAGAEDLMLTCNGGGHIVLRPGQGRAELIDHDPVVIGSLTADDYVYRMVFPATEKTYEIQIRINRYTGRFEWEFGSSYRTGTCLVGDALRKF